MIEFIKKLLDESTNYSTQRFSLLIILFLTITLTIVNIVLCFQTANIIYINSITDLIYGILGIGITGKVVQRFAEKSIDKEQGK